MESAYDTYQDQSTGKDDEDDEEEEEEEDPCAIPESTSTTSAATRDDSSTSTDFSLKGFLQEVLTEFEKDVHRMTSLFLPVIKPIYTAGNKAWNYVKWVFKSAKAGYQKYKDANTPPSSQQHSSSSKTGSNNPLETK